MLKQLQDVVKTHEKGKILKKTKRRDIFVVKSYLIIQWLVSVGLLSIAEQSQLFNLVY